MMGHAKEKAMSSNCPKCGEGLKTKQVKNILTGYCAHCGRMPWGINVKTGQTVTVKR
jgi:Zn-finger nucleic acid-binding protein